MCDAADYTPYASVQSFDYTNSPVSGGATAASIFFTQAIWGEQVDATKTLYEGTIQGITGTIIITLITTLNNIIIIISFSYFLAAI